MTGNPHSDNSSPAANGGDFARTVNVDGAAVDLGRAVRCGFPEVVFGEGKPPELVVDILKTQRAAGQRSLVTRVNNEQVQAVQDAFPEVQYHQLARTLTLTLPDEILPDIVSGMEHAADSRLQVAVVTAGSSDAAVAAEAAETLRWMGVHTISICDVGVAGPQRLLPWVPVLQRMQVVVCVAGMEAALPSVIGGYLSCPVIGVPTSVGYGASFQGVTAMLSMLTCCASNVVSVNIDAGFRGGYVAGLIVKGSAEWPKSQLDSET